MKDALTRRDFLKTSAIFSACGIAPQFLARTAHAATGSAGLPEDRILVVVQLGGGNDGLNTVVPYEDDAYARVRPTLRLEDKDLITLDGNFALNAGADGLADLYNDGQLAIVHGVGYPNPDRSHFRSMEIWHTASDADHYSSTGWIGRYFDQECQGAPAHTGVAIGTERPQAFDGKSGIGVAFTEPNQFGWQPGAGIADEEIFAALNQDSGQNESVDFLRHVTSQAISSSHDVRDAAHRAGFKGGAGSLHRSLQLIAAMIKGELDTRIYYASLSGFDTHANQFNRHRNLLKQTGNALRAFQNRLRKDGTGERVLTVVFSEFGRRVAENQSEGTDHGTANPMFLIGDGIEPGFHGVPPDLNNLQDGDLRHTTDFRSVYASILQDWFRVRPETVLGRSFHPPGVIRAG